MIRLRAWLRRRGWKFWLAAAIVPPIILWLVAGVAVSLLLTQARPSDVPDWTDLDGHPIEAADRKRSTVSPCAVG